MGFWQIKFNMRRGNWLEFETIAAGEKFNQSISAYKKMQNCIGDIVFYYQTDHKKGIGIHFIAEIISEPYREEYNTGYAIDLRIVKRLEVPFNDRKSNIYNALQVKLNPMGMGASKYLLKDEDNGKKLYQLLMDDSKIALENKIKIDKNILDRLEKIKKRYIDNGYLFNAFHNLNMIKGEVKHLAFIGHLLDPYGNHFKKDLFLTYFIDSLLGYHDLKKNKFLQNFTKNNPYVEIEKTIRGDNNKILGRIDLWLENDEYIIAIEGKIEAKDSERQLETYDEYLKKQDKKYILLYLTLRKNENPEKAHLNKLKSFHLINFEQDILEFINDAIDDKNIIDNIYGTLLDYRDALLKYIYIYHLSFEYSYELIQEMTKNKQVFEKFKDIKEHYYQNKEMLKNTVNKDIAENFEYAKANIERLFFINLNKNILATDTYSLHDDSTLQLNDEKYCIAQEIYTIDKIRKRRLNPIVTENFMDLGSIYMKYYYSENKGTACISIVNNCEGVYYDGTGYCDDQCFINLNNSDFLHHKLNKFIFKSDLISNLLDFEYSSKIINDIINQ